MKKKKICLICGMLSALLVMQTVGAEMTVDNEQILDTVPEYTQESEEETEALQTEDPQTEEESDDLSYETVLSEAVDVLLEFIDGSCDSGAEVRIVCEAVPELVSWEISTDGILYDEIENEHGESYIVRNSDSGKYIRAVLTIEGMDSYSEPFLAGKAYPSKEERPNYQGDNFNKVISKSPEEYVFKLNDSDKRFVLLKETDSAASRYFVAAYDDYGKHVFDSEKGSGLKFDPERESNIAYFLNHDFIDENSEYENKLPKDIIQYIDMSHTWITHTPMSGSSGDLEPYKVKCGVSLLSKEEFYEYCDKTKGAGENPRLGVIDNINGGIEDEQSGWMLRSAKNPYAILSFAISPSAGTNMKESGPSAEELFIRPVFYLNEDFFRNVQLDLGATGSDIINVLKNNYTRSELAQIYSQDDLIEIYGKDVIKINQCRKTDLDNGSVIEVEVENIDVFDMDVTLIAVCYDADSSMVSMSEKECHIGAGQTVSAQMSLNGDLSDAEQICFFIWDSIESQISLSETIQF